jgi:hypothetical protein
MRPHECLKELTCPDLPTQEVDSTKSRGTLRELKYDSSFTITFPLFDKDNPTDVLHGYGTAQTKEKCRKKECTTEPIQTLFRRGVAHSITSPFQLCSSVTRA